MNKSRIQTLADKNLDLLYTVTGQPIFIEIIFSRILSVPIGGPSNGILVAPNKRS